MKHVQVDAFHLKDVLLGDTKRITTLAGAASHVAQELNMMLNWEHDPQVGKTDLARWHKILTDALEANRT